MLVIIVNLILQAKLKREQSNSQALFFEFLIIVGVKLMVIQ